MKILSLQSNPRPNDSIPLSNAVPGGYRLEVEEVGYKLLYVVDDEKESVTVFAISR